MNYSKVSAAISAALGVAAIWAPINASWAQAAAAPEADALQEVIITAERRATDVQTTPLAVVAVSGEDLVSKQVVNVTALSLTAPSITMYDRGGTYTGVNIRGIGNSSNVPQIQSGVAVIRDGTYLPEPIGHNVPFFDIADTEVLRGPQGTFVGASAIGGAVLINSQSPKLDGSTSGFASATVGDYYLSVMQAAINLPVSDTFAARVAVNSDRRNSFYKAAPDILGGTPTSPWADPGNQNNRNVRIGLRYKPNEKWDVVFKYENNYGLTDGSTAQVATNTFTPLINTANCVTSANPLGGSPNQFTCGAYTGSPLHGNAFYNPNAAYNTNPFALDYGIPAATKFNMEQVSYILDTKYNFDSGNALRSVTGFRHFHVIDTNDSDLTSLPRTLNYHEIGPNNDYFSQEFTLASPADQRLSWVGGVFGFYRDTVVRSSTYTYNLINGATGTPLASSGVNGTGVWPSPAGYDGQIYTSCTAAAVANQAVPAGCVVAAPNTPILNTAGILQGYVPGIIQYTGQQISNVTYGSQGAVQRMGAIFGKVTYKVSDQLDFEVGARWSWDSNFQYNDNSRIGQFSISYVRDNTGRLNGYMTRANCVVGANGVSTNTSTLGSGGGCLDQRASVGNFDSQPSYKLGLNWKPSDGQFAYLFFAHGFKAAGLGNQQNAVKYRTFNIEKVNDIELGWKSKWLDNRVNTSLGLYYTMDDGFQYNLFDPTTRVTAVGNLSGTTTLYGLEGTINAKYHGWVVDASAAYSKSKLGSADQVPDYLLLAGGSATINGTPTTINAANASQCGPSNTNALCFNYTPYAVHLAGTSNPLAPTFTANIQLGYEFLAGNGLIRPRVNFAYTGAAYGSLFQTTNTFLMNQRSLWNANLDYENGPWNASLFGTNITDVKYQTDASSTTSTYWGAPRQVGLRFTRKF